MTAIAPAAARARMRGDGESRRMTSVRDDGAQHMAAGKAVAAAGGRKELAETRTVALGNGGGRTQVVQVVSIEELESDGGEEHHEHQGVRPEARAPQVNGERQHQNSCHLDATELCDGLEYRMQRRLPDRVHGLRDLQIELREETGADRDRQRDEDDDQHADRDKTRGQRWQRRQKTVVLPAIRIAASGRPHVKQGSPARP